jgi:hypothetical protein
VLHVGRIEDIGATREEERDDIKSYERGDTCGVEGGIEGGSRDRNSKKS